MQMPVVALILKYCYSTVCIYYLEGI